MGRRRSRTRPVLLMDGAEEAVVAENGIRRPRGGEVEVEGQIQDGEARMSIVDGMSTTTKGGVKIREATSGGMMTGIKAGTTISGIMVVNGTMGGSGSGDKNRRMTDGQIGRRIMGRRGRTKLNRPRRLSRGIMMGG